MTSRRSATAPLRMAGYAAILVAMAFSQSGGLMVADSKFDLVTAPGRFLAKALELWDPMAAFGQIQNQAYGYLWPMGPFFLLGHLVHFPEWAVQRLWWSLLLCLAFFGVVRLAQRLGLGTPWAQVAAGFAYVLTPRLTTLIGPTSVEVWPMALAPWVLLPLVGATQRGSTRRAAAVSALVVASCGGVNAIAVSAVLPLGVIWILTRAPGPRRWPLLGWWTLFTGLATFWWWGPLLIMGRYSPPFLDYIENATITTLPTDLTKTLLGTSDWVAYFAGFDYTAGNVLVTTPFLLLDAAAVAALGLVGIALRGNPHQRFLTLGLLTGATLVGLGYAGDLAGFLAQARLEALDQALAPFRNLHKYDVVLRLPLVLGMAHALASLPSLFSGVHGRRTVLLTRGVTGLVLLALALPWLNNQIAPRDGVRAVPDYWPAVASYLEATDDGTVALLVPASGFGVYTWGNTHDDVMQGLATSPWAVRNVIPLAQPGNVALLDAVTAVLESGRPNPQLAPFLATNGIGRLVVRNDLDRFQTATPDPVGLHRVLEDSPGLTLARSFGPTVGSAPYLFDPDSGTRLVTGDGASTRVPSVQVYDVAEAAAATVQPLPQALAGDPGSGSEVAMGDFGDAPRPLAQDAPVDEYPAVLLTDGLRRREKNFARVRDNESQTMPAGDPFRLGGPEHRHRLGDDQDRWETTETWTGTVSRVLGSTAQSYADAPVPIQRGAHPGAALDGDPSTRWLSASDQQPVGQWWQADLRTPEPVGQVAVTLSPDSAPVSRLRISTGRDSVDVAAPEPGETGEYAVGLAAGPYLRVTAVGEPLAVPGSLALSEVSSPVLRTQRYLTLPAVTPGARVDGVALSRDQEPAACVLVEPAFVCNDALVTEGEDGDTLARRFTLPYAEGFEPRLTGSLRRTPGAGAALLAREGIAVAAETSPHGDVASSPVAIVDDDDATTWVAPGVPRFRVTLAEPERLESVRLRVNPGAAAASPSTVRVSHGSWSQTVTLDASGEAALAGPRTRSFRIQILRSRPAFSVQGQSFVQLPPGVSDLRVNGRSPTGWAGRTLDLPCGTGPSVSLDGALRETRVTATARQLIRGERVPVQLCRNAGSRAAGPRLELRQGENTLLARASDLLRLDGLALQGPQLARTGPTPVAVTRDETLAPTGLTLSPSSQPRLLTLPQNVNPGWTAALDGEPLRQQRVDGWKQGWIVPAGAAGRVSLDFEPADGFRLALLVGAGLVLLTVLAAAWPARRSVQAPAQQGRPGVLDLVLVVAAGGLLAGLPGLVLLGGGVAAGLLLPRFRGWPLVGAAALLGASLGLVWSWLEGQSWAGEWSQLAALVALAAAVAALAALRRETPPVRTRSGRAGRGHTGSQGAHPDRLHAQSRL